MIEFSNVNMNRLQLHNFLNIRLSLALCLLFKEKNLCILCVLFDFYSELILFYPLLLTFWKGLRNIFFQWSNEVSLQLLSYFPQAWSWSWTSCCRSSRMWWRSWRPLLRAEAMRTSTSCRRPKTAQGWGTTVEWRTQITVSDTIFITFPRLRWCLFIV